MVDAFPVCKDVQSAVGEGEKHGYNHGDILFYMANHFFFTARTTETAFLSIPLVGSLTHCKYSLTCDVASKLSYTHDIL